MQNHKLISHSLDLHYNIHLAYKPSQYHHANELLNEQLINQFFPLCFISKLIGKF